MATKKVTKADMVGALYEQTGISRKEIATILDLFVRQVKSSLIDGQVIELRGFGTFEVKIRKARTGARNPKTGEPVDVRAHGVVSFRPGQDMKLGVWNIVGRAEEPERPA
ncbi:MAG: HU family DNA-binding protein [Treponema sp.]|jgi:integration host factor subunit beta|nr:HU family DNA-binding protein [Treponema sp.]